MLNELNETEKQLKAFRDYVVKESKSNLTRLKKNSSKKLYDSIKGEYKVMPNSFSMEFDMEDYGTFQDKGVNGLEVRRESNNSRVATPPFIKQPDPRMTAQAVYTFLAEDLL